MARKSRKKSREMEELLNALKLGKGKNLLLFAISEQPERLKRAIESSNFLVKDVNLPYRPDFRILKEGENLLEILSQWEDTPENCVYLVYGIKNQFPWILPYINLHRELFPDVKRPIVVVVNEYEIREIQKHAPDWFKFESGEYVFTKEELGEDNAENLPSSEKESKLIRELFGSYPFLKEGSEEEIKEIMNQIRLNKYMLKTRRELDNFQRAEIYKKLSESWYKLGYSDLGMKYLLEYKKTIEKTQK